MQDKIKHLSNIKKMLDDGIISREEFDLLKKDILGIKNNDGAANVENPIKSDEQISQKSHSRKRKFSLLISLAVCLLLISGYFIYTTSLRKSNHQELAKVEFSKLSDTIKMDAGENSQNYKTKQDSRSLPARTETVIATYNSSQESIDLNVEEKFDKPIILFNDVSKNGIYSEVAFSNKSFDGKIIPEFWDFKISESDTGAHGITNYHIVKENVGKKYKLVYFRKGNNEAWIIVKFELMKN